MAELELNDFARTLIADTQATAEAEQTSIPGTFTRRVLEDLEQAGGGRPTRSVTTASPSALRRAWPSADVVSRRLRTTSIGSTSCE